MAKRSGITLMEVLVAIFIMGIGMLAMLVLFPLGVLRMAQSIQLERCAQAGYQAAGIAGSQGLRNDPWVLFDQNPGGIPGSGSPITAVLVTGAGAGYVVPPTVTFSPPQLGGATATGTATLGAGGSVAGIKLTSAGTGYTQVPLVTLSPPPPGGTQAVAVVADPFMFPGNGWTLLPADPRGPSYPVFLDPMGYSSLSGLANQFWVGGLTAGNTVPRRTSQYCLAGGVPNLYQTLRWTCLLDEIPFADDGTIDYDLAPVFTRGINYSWSYMLRRPRTSDPSLVELTVVVYGNRPVLSSLINENVYQTQNQAGGLSEVTFDPVGNSITIAPSAGNVVPTARPGDWLLDASYVPSQSGNFGTVNGYFYRVVSVTENPDASFTFELQQPLRNMTATMAVMPGNPGPAGQVCQKIIFLEGVAEVFEKGVGRNP